MLYIVFVTALCNLRCAYCGGSVSEHIMPPKINYSIEKFAKFVRSDRDKVIGFYGGEPTLFPDTIKEFINLVDDARFVLQTNGLLLNRLPQEVYRELDAILVSIDGRRKTTDTYRGRGVYDRVIDALKSFRTNYRGEIIARMVVTEVSDIYEDVMHLLKLGLFDYVHWQLDVVWSDRWSDFEGWLENSYYPGLEKLASVWKEALRTERRILGIVPFLGILKRILFGGYGLHCGAGETAISISTDGKIYACPICGEFDWNILGNINNSKLHEVFFRDLIPDDCKSCKIYDRCGGRCLFASRERLWGEDKHRKVCETVRYLVDIVENELLEVVLESLEKGVFRLRDFYYPEYNNTCEIIP